MFGEFRELMAQAYIQMRLQIEASRDAKQISYAVDTIIREINSSLSTLPSGEVLTVFLGEEHSGTAQIVAQKKLSEALEAQNTPYCFTYENRKGSVTDATQRSTAQILNSLGRIDEFSHVIQSIDNDPAMETYRLICAKNTINTPIARTDFHYFLLAHKTPFAFNDAALIFDPQNRANTVLNFHDPKTRNAIFEAIDRLDVKTNTLANINAGSELGMLGRNVHIKRANQELHHKLKDVRVLLSNLGGNHPAGHQDHDYKTSLAHLYQEEKKPFLAVLFSPSAAPRAERARANGANVLHLPLSSQSHFERPRDWDGNIRENDDLLWREAEYLERLSTAFHESKSATEYKNKFDRLDHDIAQSIKRHVHRGNAPEIDQPT